MKRSLGLLFCLLALAQSVHAFDGKRKGFSISVGGGLHALRVDASDSFFQDSYSINESGLATSFKIGGGITEQLSLYYVRNGSWYNDTYKFVVGLAGIGGSYYTSPSQPSFYILGAVGVADMDAPFADNIEPETGDAFMLGFGYEYGSNFLVEGTYLATSFDEMDSSSIQLTANYRWY